MLILFGFQTLLTLLWIRDTIQPGVLPLIIPKPNKISCHESPALIGKKNKTLVTKQNDGTPYKTHTHVGQQSLLRTLVTVFLRRRLIQGLGPIDYKSKPIAMAFGETRRDKN